jgi:nitrogen fixation-related uncharacterized protein
VLVLLVVAGCGAALALAGFVWAVTHGHLDAGKAGAMVIFDGDEERGGE